MYIYTPRSHFSIETDHRGIQRRGGIYSMEEIQVVRVTTSVQSHVNGIKELNSSKFKVLNPR